MSLLAIFRHPKPERRVAVLDTALLSAACKPAGIRPSCVPLRPPAYRRTESGRETLKAA